MNKWLSMIYDRVLCICRSVNAQARSAVYKAQSDSEVYDLTDFGIPAGARVTSFSVYVKGAASALLRIPTFGSPPLAPGWTTIDPGPAGYLTVDDWQIEIISATVSDPVVVSATYYMPA